MKTEKQKIWMNVLTLGLYRVDVKTGKIYRSHKGGWKLLRVSPLPSGYIQYNIKYKKRGSIFVYGQIAVWIAANGEYEAGMKINHNDFDRGNNSIDNLTLMTQAQNNEYSSLAKRRPSHAGAKLRRFSKGEVKDIRFYLKDGVTQMDIAKRMGLKRISVAYVCRQIAAGKTLRCEAA